MKTSKKQLTKQTYHRNRSFAMDKTNMDLESFNGFIFELGDAFLQRHYPSAGSGTTPEWQKLYWQHSKSKTFWNWWQNEFDNWLADFIYYCSFNSIEMTEEKLRSEFDKMQQDGYVEVGFQENYKKHAYVTI